MATENDTAEPKTPVAKAWWKIFRSEGARGEHSGSGPPMGRAWEHEVFYRGLGAYVVIAERAHRREIRADNIELARLAFLYDPDIVEEHYRQKQIRSMKSRWREALGAKEGTAVISDASDASVEFEFIFGDDELVVRLNGSTVTGWSSDAVRVAPLFDFVRDAQHRAINNEHLAKQLLVEAFLWKARGDARDRAAERLAQAPLGELVGHAESAEAARRRGERISLPYDSTVAGQGVSLSRRDGRLIGRGLTLAASVASPQDVGKIQKHWTEQIARGERRDVVSSVESLEAAGKAPRSRRARLMIAVGAILLPIGWAWGILRFLSVNGLVTFPEPWRAVVEIKVLPDGGGQGVTSTGISKPAWTLQDAETGATFTLLKSRVDPSKMEITMDLRGIQERFMKNNHQGHLHRAEDIPLGVRVGDDRYIAIPFDYNTDVRGLVVPMIYAARLPGEKFRSVLWIAPPFHIPTADVMATRAVVKMPGGRIVPTYVEMIGGMPVFATVSTVEALPGTHVFEGTIMHKSYGSMEVKQSMAVAGDGSVTLLTYTWSLPERFLTTPPPQFFLSRYKSSP